jgi:hypothetical protein
VLTIERKDSTAGTLRIIAVDLNSPVSQGTSVTATPRRPNGVMFISAGGPAVQLRRVPRAPCDAGRKHHCDLLTIRALSRSGVVRELGRPKAFRVR